MQEFGALVRLTRDDGRRRENLNATLGGERGGRPRQIKDVNREVRGADTGRFARLRRGIRPVPGE